MPHPECFGCLNEITKKAIELSTSDKKGQIELLEKITKYTKESFPNIKLPDFSTEIFKIISDETGTIDPFLDIKRESNEYFKKLIPKMLDSIEGLYVKNILYKLLLYSIAANMVDFSTGGHSVDLNEIANTIIDFPDEGLAVDNFQEIYEKIMDAQKIIYLSDNCGEVVVDNLVVEFIKNAWNKEIYLGLKGGPVANDCSLDDFKRDGLPFNATKTFIVSSSFGYNLHQVTDEFKALLSNADLLIVKGQSNYETTLNNLARYPDFNFPPIFCVLRTKCQIITNHISVPLGSNVIKQMYPYQDGSKITEIVDC